MKCKKENYKEGCFKDVEDEDLEAYMMIECVLKLPKVFRDKKIGKSSYTVIRHYDNKC